MPWDNVTLAGGPVISVIISGLKKLKLIRTKGQVKAGVLVLGAGWLMASYAMNGKSAGDALISSVVSVLSAPGFYELIGKPLKTAKA